MANEARCSLILGLLVGLPRDTAIPIAATVHDRESVVAVAMAMPKRALLLSHGPTAAADELVTALRDREALVPSVVGPTAMAQHFAQRWDPTHAKLRLRMRVHQLEAINPVPPPPGRMREATIDDTAWLAPWAESFATQSGSGDARPGAQIVGPLLESRQLHVWEDGEATSMVGWSRGTPHTASITIVYTPPAHRGRGYATALVAELAASLLTRGKRWCVLYTNLANPEVAAIYARIGFNPVEDHASWIFP